MADVFVPLNRFQSVISELTGEEDNIYNTPSGVSTIVLSAQITNTGETTHPITIFVDSNKNLPVPQFGNVYSGSFFISGSDKIDISYLSGSFESASALLTLNRQFIIKEVGAYTQFVNNLSEEPFGYSASFYETNIGRDVDGIAYDIINDTTIRTNKAALAYYNKNGISLIPTGQVTASINAVQYGNYLAQQIIKNQSVTGSENVSRLYQTSVTQSIDTDYSVTESEVSGSSYLIESLYNVIKTNIQDPTLVAQTPIDLIRNVDIPAHDSLSPVVAGKLVMEEGYGLIVSGSTELKVILSLLESANE